MKKPTPQQINAKAQQAYALAQRGQLMQAAALLGPVMPHAKAMPAVLDLYASVRASQGHHAEAADYYRQILRGNHTAHDTRHRLAVCLRRMGRFDEAIQQIERIRETEPWAPSPVLSLVDIYGALGMHAASVALLDDLEANAPSHAISDAIAARITIARTRISGETADADAALRQAENESLTPDTRAALATHAGRAYDNAGRADDAFAALSLGKSYRNLAFDADEYRRRIDACIAFWTDGEGAALPATDHDGSGFVFIVGMPRSGTSLLEQMLGRLPGVAPMGERAEIVRLAGGINTPDREDMPTLVTAIGRYTTENMGQIMPRVLADYREAADRVEPGAATLVDKQVFNFFHLPLIARVLPGARVLHIARNPADTAISCYSQWFNRRYHFTADMAALGAYYRGYRRVVDAWRALPAPAGRPEMLDVQYERLVREPEPAMREILGFLGLPWDERALSPEQADRVVMTASRDQVRSAINTKAVARWKPYESHLAPFFASAGPEIEADARTER
ncbi:MAG: sulfotransferase [Planctomycetota bacterium]